MVNTMTFSVANNGILVATAGIIAEDCNTGTPNASPSFSTKALANFTHATVTYNSVAKSVYDVSITINNNLEARRFLGSNLIKQPIRTAKREITGTFTMDFEGTTEYDDFIAATERTLDIDFTGASINVSTYKLLFDMNYVLLEDTTTSVSNEGAITATFPFRAYSSTTNKELTVELTNTETSV